MVSGNVDERGEEIIPATRSVYSDEKREELVVTPLPRLEDASGVARQSNHATAEDDDDDDDDDILENGTTSTTRRKGLNPSIRKIITKDVWSDDANAAAEGLTNLSGMCDKGFLTTGWERNIRMAARMGGPLAIVKAMEKNVGELVVQRAGCRALMWLAMDDVVRGHIGYVGGVEIVFTAMKDFPDDNCVQRFACGALKNFIWSNDENYQEVVDLNGIPIIVAAMRAFIDDSDLQGWACTALYFLARGDPLVKDIIVREGGIVVIAQAAQAHLNVAWVQEWAHKAMAKVWARPS